MSHLSPAFSHPFFSHVPHPRIAERREESPPSIAAEHIGINGKIALRLTKIVGTMWCAYTFAVLALIVLPQAASSPLLLVQWISQTFIQLVMLSILMVGQNIQGRAADKRAISTYADAEAILHEALSLQRHLEVQDKVLVAVTRAAQSVSARHTRARVAARHLARS